MGCRRSGRTPPGAAPAPPACYQRARMRLRATRTSRRSSVVIRYHSALVYSAGCDRGGPPAPGVRGRAWVRGRAEADDRGLYPGAPAPGGHAPGPAAGCAAPRTWSRSPRVPTETIRRTASSGPRGLREHPHQPAVPPPPPREGRRRCRRVRAPLDSSTNRSTVPPARIRCGAARPVASAFDMSAASPSETVDDWLARIYCEKPDL